MENLQQFAEITFNKLFLNFGSETLNYLSDSSMSVLQDILKSGIAKVKNPIDKEILIDKLRCLFEGKLQIFQ